MIFSETLFWAAVWKLLFLAVALLTCVGFSWWLDVRAHSKVYASMDSALMRGNALGFAIYRGLRWFGICFLAAHLLGCSPAGAATYPDKYDATIKKAVGQFWPDLPEPLLWKAQLYTESALNPDARSPVGAEGLAQFMPATWIEVSRALQFGIVPRSMAEPAIIGGAYYQARQREMWNGRDRTAWEANELGAASYNAGAGNVLRAQRICNNERLWQVISLCLWRVTGPVNAAETIAYPLRIAKHFAAMKAGVQ